MSQSQVIKEFLYQVPKVELHIHMEATIRPETLFTIADRNGVDPSIQSVEDVRKKFQFTNLNEFIGIFLFLQRCFKVPEDFALLFDDAVRYFQENNIRYAEVFFSPTTFLRLGFKYPDIIAIFDERIETARRETGIEIRLIIDVSRTFGSKNAAFNLGLVTEHSTQHVIGIGLGGSETAHPSDDFIHVFKQAKAAGLHVVAHAGEDLGAKSVWGALKLLYAERIGHGIAAMEDQSLMTYLREQAIPLEICPTSNLFTGRYVKKIEHHPVRMFFDQGLKVTINSDDPVFFNATMSDELLLLHEHLGFSIEELMTILRNNVDASFASNKKELNDELDRRSKELGDEYGLSV